MKFNIIVDSVGDYDEIHRENGIIKTAPLIMTIDNEVILDNGNVDQNFLLDKIANCKTCPKSACASPDSYFELFESIDAERIYVLAASSKLTGCFESANVALAKFLENENKNKKICVIDTKTAASGVAIVVEKIIEMESEGLPFDEIVDKSKQFIEGQHTRFVLEDFTYLQKNGRLGGIKLLIAKNLHIVPIFTANNGEISKAGQSFGTMRAYKILIDMISKDCKDKNCNQMIISHCNNEPMAVKIMEKLKEVFDNLKIKILQTRFISTLYAGNKGIIISY